MLKRSTIAAVVIAFVLGMAIGCWLSSQFDLSTSEPSIQVEPQIKPTHEVFARRFRVLEGSVYDGDSFRIEGYDGVNERVRLALIDAPELDEPGGIQARDRLRELIDGLWIDVRFSDPKGRKRDHFGRLLMSIKVDGVDIESKLVEEKFAVWRP